MAVKLAVRLGLVYNCPACTTDAYFSLNASINNKI